jgi:hypothetical protein
MNYHAQFVTHLFVSFIQAMGKEGGRADTSFIHLDML